MNLYEDVVLQSVLELLLKQQSFSIEELQEHLFWFKKCDLTKDEISDILKENHIKPRGD